MRRDEPGRMDHEASLMARLASGEREAPLLALYSAYGSSLYGIGVRLLDDRGLAEELVQETFVRLWRSAPRYDPGRGSVATFLFTIARRTAVDLQRRPSSRRFVELDDGTSEQQAAFEPVDDGVFDRLVLGMDVRDAMGTLSEDHRQVLELHYDEDLTQLQISQKLRIPLGTVKTRTYHALRALRVELERRRILA